MLRFQIHMPRGVTEPTCADRWMPWMTYSGSVYNSPPFAKINHTLRVSAKIHPWSRLSKDKVAIWEWSSAYFGMIPEGCYPTRDTTSLSNVHTDMHVSLTSELGMDFELPPDFGNFRVMARIIGHFNLEFWNKKTPIVAINKSSLSTSPLVRHATDNTLSTTDRESRTLPTQPLSVGNKGWVKHHRDIVQLFRTLITSSMEDLRKTNLEQGSISNLWIPELQGIVYNSVPFSLYNTYSSLRHFPLKPRFETW